MAIALQKLSRMKPHVQREAMKHANNAFIHSMCSHIRKLRTTPVSPKLRKRIQKHKKYLQKFLRKKTSMAVKRKMLSQRGGGIAALVPIIISALPAIGSMIGNAIARVRRRR